MNSLKGYIFAVLCVAAVTGSVDMAGQAHPERRHIRFGNRDYEMQNYSAGEGDYRTAIEKNPDSFEARFNLGDALYKQERFEEAAETFAGLAESPHLTAEQAARTFYNLGNAQFSQQLLQEALESYKMSLRFNPDDMEAKYNLAYVQKLLEEQDEDGEGNDNRDDQDDGDDRNDQGNGNDDDRDNDGQDDPDSGDDDKQDGQDDKQDGQDDPDSGDDDKQDGQDDAEQDKPSPQESEESLISQEDAEQMLDAIQSQEDKTREKVNEQNQATVGRSGRNW